MMSVKEKRKDYTEEVTSSFSISGWEAHLVPRCKLSFQWRLSKVNYLSI